jgi:outer membrane protein assembly factor BamD
LIALGCGSDSDQLTKTPPKEAVEQQFSEGKAAYTKEDYVEASRLFEDVRLQAPASNIAAEATYLEAMSGFNQEKYATSAADFRAVRRNYASSPFAARAQYMVGESYYQASPRAELDQTYTVLALTEFQNFLHDFPTGSSAWASSTSGGASTSNLDNRASKAEMSLAGSSLVDSAQARILELRKRLAQKYFLSAQLYDKLEYFKASTVYYQRVLDNFYDTPPAPESELRLAEINAGTNKLDDARKCLDAFDTKYLQLATADERTRALTLHNKLAQN